MANKQDIENRLRKIERLQKQRRGIDEKLAAINEKLAGLMGLKREDDAGEDENKPSGFSSTEEVRKVFEENPNKLLNTEEVRARVEGATGYKPPKKDIYASLAYLASQRGKKVIERTAERGYFILQDKK